jgi:hypothetical protein
VDLTNLRQHIPGFVWVFYEARVLGMDGMKLGVFKVSLGFQVCCSED